MHAPRFVGVKIHRAFFSLRLSRMRSFRYRHEIAVSCSLLRRRERSAGGNHSGNRCRIIGAWVIKAVDVAACCAEKRSQEPRTPNLALQSFQLFNDAQL